MRGKDGVVSIVDTAEGITPAYAGKREPSDLMLSMPTGSPPPMRGKALPAALAIGGAGITPAYAGKSVYILICSYPARDHPRLCGEKCIHYILFRNGVGSPPPMRGKVDGCMQAIAKLRITPAYAGKS